MRTLSQIYYDIDKEDSIKKAGVSYIKPKVTLLHASPLWIAEVAGRTAYNSFNKSEHELIRAKNYEELILKPCGHHYKSVDIESSDILTSLAWVHHHHSVLELIDLTFSIEGTSRGVLQEHSRHRLQSLTVQSTRYTMSSVLNAFVTAHSQWSSNDQIRAKEVFYDIMSKLDLFVLKDAAMVHIETDTIYSKLALQLKTRAIKYEDMISKESLQILNDWEFGKDGLFNKMEATKKVRNIGDNFKHIVTDNWKVDLICKFNLRSLKNYFTLRDSGAAYFQIRMLAEAMKEATPNKYLDLIVKRKSSNENN